MSNRNPNPNNHWLTILGGIVLVLSTNFLLSILGMYLFALLADNVTVFRGLGYNAFTIGLSAVWIYQLLYVIPLVLSCRRQRNFAFMKGVIIGAVITALIAGFCFVQFISFVIAPN